MFADSGQTLVGDTITTELNVHPGHALRKKLKFSLKQKSHPLLLDPEINSHDTVLSNVYQTFMFVVRKFHAFVKEMPKGK